MGIISGIKNIVGGAITVAKKIFTIGAGVAVGVGIVKTIQRFSSQREAETDMAEYESGRMALERVGLKMQKTAMESEIELKTELMKSLSDLVSSIASNPRMTEFLIEEYRGFKERKEEEKRLALQEEEKKRAAELMAKLKEDEDKAMKTLRGNLEGMMSLDQLSSVVSANSAFVGICLNEKCVFTCGGQQLLVPAPAIKCIARSPSRGRNLVVLLDGSVYAADEGERIQLNFFSAGFKQHLELGDDLVSVRGLMLPETKDFVRQIEDYVKQREEEIIAAASPELAEFFDLCRRFSQPPEGAEMAGQKMLLNSPAAISFERQKRLDEIRLELVLYHCKKNSQGGGAEISKFMDALSKSAKAFAEANRKRGEAGIQAQLEEYQTITKRIFTAADSRNYFGGNILCSKILCYLEWETRQKQSL